MFCIIKCGSASKPLNLGCKGIASSTRRRRFKNTSSTKLEIQTVLWALEELCLRAFAKKSQAGKQLFPPDQ
jgi:hypothetical protein